MTTSQDKLQNQIQQKGNYAVYRGTFENAFGDPRGVNPKPEYQEQSSLNKSTTGEQKHQLEGYQGIPGVEIGQDDTPAEYPFCQTQESLAGHVIEMDDTKGSERLLIKHSSGAGVEMRADGTVILTTKRNQITVVNGSQTVKVEGDAKMMYDNLTVEVAGDYNLNVKGNINTTAGGDISTACDHNTEVVEGNKNTKVMGNVSDTVIGSKAAMIMGEVNDIVKGERTIASGAGLTMASTGVLKLSSEDKIIGSASNTIQMGANKLNLMAASGTIGGAGVIAYVDNIYGGSGTFAEAVTAPTFHGDLDGVANEARQSRHQLYSDPDTGPGSGGNVGSPGAAITNITTDTTATFEPTSALMGLYTTGNTGVNDIQIDLDDHLKNAIDQTINTNGKAKSPQTTAQIRSSLKDNANLTDKHYTANAVADGKLSAKYTQPAPGRVGRTVNNQPTATRIYSTVQ